MFAEVAGFARYLVTWKAVVGFLWVKETGLTLLAMRLTSLKLETALLPEHPHPKDYRYDLLRRELEKNGQLFFFLFFLPSFLLVFVKTNNLSYLLNTRLAVYTVLD